jgi:hypothetical protein
LRIGLCKRKKNNDARDEWWGMQSAVCLVLSAGCRVLSAENVEPFTVSTGITSLIILIIVLKGNLYLIEYLSMFLINFFNGFHLIQLSG